ncbi:MAG: hypothetical protein JSW39_27545 [Desulfobacterales bacterium]|nr:MAG: hypothetical protein JSW39_27545 [Desulfobacterales bacterium]
MPRRARWDAPGTWQPVVERGIEKRKILNGKQARDKFISRMGRTAIESGMVMKKCVACV